MERFSYDLNARRRSLDLIFKGIVISFLPLPFSFSFVCNYFIKIFSWTPMWYGSLCRADKCTGMIPTCKQLGVKSGVVFAHVGGSMQRRGVRKGRKEVLIALAFNSKVYYFNLLSIIHGISRRNFYTLWFKKTWSDPVIFGGPEPIATWGALIHVLSIAPLIL